MLSLFEIFFAGLLTSHLIVLDFFFTILCFSFFLLRRIIFIKKEINLKSFILRLFSILGIELLFCFVFSLGSSFLLMELFSKDNEIAGAVIGIMCFSYTLVSCSIISILAIVILVYGSLLQRRRTS